MIYNLKTVRKQVLGLALSEVGFKARGFEPGHEAQSRLELVAKTVVHGYNVAVENGLGADLEATSSSIKNELCGFFNEGVGMGLYALDLFSLPGKKKYWRYIYGAGNPHEYMAYIGAGLASGVFNIPFKKFLEKASPTSGCLVLDGIGFYHAYFKTKQTIVNGHVPASIKYDPFFLERFDNGLGRAVWFYNSGEPYDIANTISRFPGHRRAAIWSGVGLAATYAGGVTQEKILLLKKLSGEYALMLAQGSVLATHTRHRAGNPHTNDNTERILVGRSSIDCHQFALKSIDALGGRRYIDGKHSFQVFLEDIRNWIYVGDLNSEIVQNVRFAV